MGFLRKKVEAAPSVPATPEQTVCDSNEEPDILEFEKNLLEVGKRFKQHKKNSKNWKVRSRKSRKTTGRKF